MSTAFSKIVGAFVTALQQSPAVAPRIDRARSREIPGADLQVINVRFEGAIPLAQAIFGAPVDWEARIAVECYVRTRDASADVAIDPLLQRVYERLAENATLGGLVQDIGQPAIDAEYDSQGEKTGWVRLVYPVQHQTSNGLLE